MGAVLVGHRGSWTGNGIGFEYRWIRCRSADCSQGTTVSATSTYRVRESDRGRRLRLLVDRREHRGADDGVEPADGDDPAS